ncbi:MAG: twin-arginine translocase subunit TatB [Chloroflexi bacterium]|nr:twin-arginine translocase subunit TatB [Chloroflexota bacterium]
MDFLGIGWMEILVVLVVALIVFGPEKLPDISRTVGQTIRDIQKNVNEATRTLTEEEPEDVRKTREVLAAQRQGQQPSGSGPATPTSDPTSPSGSPTPFSTRQPVPPDHDQPKPPQGPA